MKKFLGVFIPVCVYLACCGSIILLANKIYNHVYWNLANKMLAAGIQKDTGILDAFNVFYGFYWASLGIPMIASLVFQIKYKAKTFKGNMGNSMFRILAILFDASCLGSILFGLSTLYFGQNAMVLIGFLGFGYIVWKVIALISSTRDESKGPCGLYWSIEDYLEDTGVFYNEISKREKVYNNYLITNKF